MLVVGDDKLLGLFVRDYVRLLGFDQDEDAQGDRAELPDLER